jgi:transposase
LEAEEKIAALVAQLIAKDVITSDLQRQVAELTAIVAELREKLDQNSRNSHRPPSSDGPGGTKHTHRKKSDRKRGGQKGHRGHHRELLPESDVSEFVDLYPDHCDACSRTLPNTPDICATRTQVTEVPPIKPHTKEFRQHAVTCKCGHTTRATGAGIIPVSPFGPRLMSMVVLLTGIYHLSRRKAVQALSDIVGVQISLGAVSSIERRVSGAIEPAVKDIWTKLDFDEVKHADATTWLLAGLTMSLWTIATKAVTVFKIVAKGTAALAEPMFAPLKGILVSDRAALFSFWAMEDRQICWAHLLRKFVLFSERTDAGAQFGHDLLGYTGLLFDYWHAYKQGKIDKETFRFWMKPVRIQFEACLRRAVSADLKKLSGSCDNILSHQAALWTFVDRDDVEPTNNHAERELRQFVLWRKRSFGTHSDRGNVFAERIMTLSHTARKQHTNVMTFLVECCLAQQIGGPSPLLLVAPTPALL